MQKKTSYSIIMIVVAAAVLAACGKAASAPQQAQGTPAEPSKKQKTVVNIGIQGKTGIFNYARDKKLFETAFGKEGAEVSWNEFQSGPPHFEALASGRIDFGSVGGTPVISGQVGGVDFKAIAVTDDGKRGNMIIIPKNSPIAGIKDLKGKKVGVAKGSSAYNFLYMAIDKAGLKGDEVNVIQLQPDEARPALDAGAIDAWSIWEPYATTAIFQAGAKVLATGADLNINAPSFLVARTKFTQEHPDLTVLFLKTYEQARQYYVGHLDEVTDQFVTTQKLDRQIISEVLKKSNPILSSITPEYAKAHQEQADFLYSVHAINKKLDVSKVLDSQFVNKALKEINK